MKRVADVARLQLVSWPVVLGWPWAILGVSFLINFALFAVFERRGVEEAPTGALSAIYIGLFVSYLTAITQFFPLALSMGVTRRTFYLGTGLFALVQAALYATLLYGLRLVEDATGGWGVSLEMFGPAFVRQDNPVLQWLVYLVPFLLAAAIGMGLGVVFKRWGQNGILTLVTVLVLLLGGAAVLLTWRQWWTDLGHWLAAQPPAAIMAGWSAVLAAVLAVAGYTALRRATP